MTIPNIKPGQIILTGKIPYPDGSPINYPYRPYLVIDIDQKNDKICTLIISSLLGKAHKAGMPTNYVLQNSIPPLKVASFVKLDSYQETKISILTDLKVAAQGQTIDSSEFSHILNNYKK